MCDYELTAVTYRLDENPPLDRKQKSRLELVIDRITSNPEERSRIAQSVEAAFEAGNGTLLVARAVDDGHGNPLEEPDWPIDIHSRFLACPECGQGFRPLEPREFSFNSPLGWCEVCDGIGTRTGVEHQSLIRDASLSLLEGALDLWPDLSQPLSKAMLKALCQTTGLPGDVPLNELSGLQQRVLFEGTGEKWIDVKRPRGTPGRGPWFSFQFKGLEEACEDASRMVAAVRRKVDAVMGEVPCSECGGSRLTAEASAVTLWKRTLDVWCRMPLGRLANELGAITLKDDERSIAGDLLRELTSRARFLDEIGLEYLDMARPAGSLSGGEMQRIRLAAQVGSGLTGVLYVLDEPTIGLHPRDTHRLIQALVRLRDLGNTIVVVEHDRDVVNAADTCLDFGPGSGREGGMIVAQASPKKLEKDKNKYYRTVLINTTCL